MIFEKSSALYNKKVMIRKLLPVLLLAAIIGTGWYALAGRENGRESRQAAAPGHQANFSRGRYSLSEPGSLWQIVNKRRPLEPTGYRPADLTAPHVPLRLGADSDQMKLRPEAARALERLFTRAAGQPADKKVSLILSSAFRPHEYQQTLYEGYVKKYGQAAADAESARPGYSEHQTGLALDVIAASHRCDVAACFADTPEGRWLVDNAWHEGFIIRYGQNQTAVTGYAYEPWHLRYVGPELAAELHNSGNPPLETFFSLPAAPDYGG